MGAGAGVAATWLGAAGAADPVVARAAPAPPSSPATVMPAMMNGRRDRCRDRSAAKELSAPIDLVVRMGLADQVAPGPGLPGSLTPSGWLAGRAVAG